MEERKVSLFALYPAQSHFLRYGKRQSLPVEHGAPCSCVYQKFDSGEQACGKFVRPLAETELEELEDCHCCFVLERSM
jgi:hypothetical protein